MRPSSHAPFHHARLQRRHQHRRHRCTRGPAVVTGRTPDWFRRQARRGGLRRGVCRSGGQGTPLCETPYRSTRTASSSDASFSLLLRKEEVKRWIQRRLAHLTVPLVFARSRRGDAVAEVLAHATRKIARALTRECARARHRLLHPNRRPFPPSTQAAHTRTPQK